MKRHHPLVISAGSYVDKGMSEGHPLTCLTTEVGQTCPIADQGGQHIRRLDCGDSNQS